MSLFQKPTTKREPKIKIGNVKVKKFRPTAVMDHQFNDDPDRLFELEKREYDSYVEFLKQRRDEINSDSHKDEESLNKRLEEIKVEVGYLTSDEKEELESLKNSGFPDWKKSEFMQFVRLNEIYGRSDLRAIARGCIMKFALYRYFLILNSDHEVL